MFKIPIVTIPIKISIIYILIYSDEFFRYKYVFRLQTAYKSYIYKINLFY